MDYCQAFELPATAAGFVKHLQELLATTAKRTDAALPSSGHVVINDTGEPVIKRGRLAVGARGNSLAAHWGVRLPIRRASSLFQRIFRVCLLVISALFGTATHPVRDLS